MLVLSRKKDERVGARITQAEAEEIFASGRGEIVIDVQVIEIRGDKIRLGFAAPKQVRIHREEIWLDIERRSQSSETLAQAVAEDSEEFERITQQAF